MATGRNNATIAKTLFMSDRAVEKHIGSVFQKLGLVDEHETNRRVMAVLAYVEASGALTVRGLRWVRPAPPPRVRPRPSHGATDQAHTHSMRTRRVTGRLHSRGLHRLVVWMGLAVFVVGVYVLVVRVRQR